MTTTLLDQWVQKLEELDVLIPRCVSTLTRFLDDVHGFKSKLGDNNVSIVLLKGQSLGMANVSTYTVGLGLGEPVSHLLSRRIFSHPSFVLSP